MKNKWILLTFLCAIFVVYTIDRAMLGPLAIPIQSDTGISDVQFGFLNAAVFWTYAAVVPLAGFLGDRMSRIKIVGLASILWSMMMVLAGFANGFWSLLLLVSFAVTVPQTFYSPAAVALLASRHKETRTIAMSCHQAAFYAGWFLSGASVALLLGVFGSWRSAYFVFGGLGLVLGIVFLAAGNGETEVEGNEDVVKSKPSFKEALRAFCCCPSALIAAFGHAAFTAVAFGYCAWGPKFVAEKFAISPGAAGTGVMFWHFVAALMTVLLTGFVTDRLVGRFPKMRLALQSIALLLSAPLLTLFGFASSLALVWIAAAVFGIMKGSFEANSVNSLFDVIPSPCRASAMGFLNVLSGVLGAFVPIGLGWLSQRSGVRGLEVGFALLGGWLIIACLLLCVSLFRTFDRDRVRDVS